MSQAIKYAATHWACQSGVLSSYIRQPHAVAVLSVPRPSPTSLMPMGSTPSDQTDGSSARHPTTSAHLQEDVDQHNVQEKLPFEVDSATKMYIAVSVNPTDLTSYRLIVHQVFQSLPQFYSEGINAHHSVEEAIAVQRAVAFVSRRIHDRTGLFVQGMHLGNNSQRPPRQRTSSADQAQTRAEGQAQTPSHTPVRAETEPTRAGATSTSKTPPQAAVALGTQEEPYFYHTHLLCRGDPDTEYLSSLLRLDSGPQNASCTTRSGRTDMAKESGLGVSAKMDSIAIDAASAQCTKSPFRVGDMKACLEQLPLGGPPIGTAIAVQSGPKRPPRSELELGSAVAAMRAAIVGSGAESDHRCSELLQQCGCSIEWSAFL